MQKFSAIAFILLLAVPLPAAAYTQEDVEACTPDAMRLCQQAFPNKIEVVLCLVKNRRQLNAACTLAFMGFIGFHSWKFWKFYKS